MRKEQQTCLINEASFGKVLRPINRILKKESLPAANKEFTTSPYTFRAVGKITHNVQASLIFDCVSELEDYIQRDQPISKVCAKRIKYLLKKQTKSNQEDNFSHFRQKTQQVSIAAEKVPFETVNQTIYEIQNIQFKVKKTTKVNRNVKENDSQLICYKQSQEILNRRVLELQQLNEKLMQQIKVNETKKAELTIKLAALQLTEAQVNEKMLLCSKQKEQLQRFFVGETKKLQQEKKQSAYKIRMLSEVLVERETELVNLWAFSL